VTKKTKEAAVSGIPHPAVTECPRAYVVLKDGETAGVTGALTASSSCP